MYNTHFLTTNGAGAAALGGGVLAFILILIAWTLVWKGLALWHAARNKQTAWYIVMLILNTAGILEIIYLIGFRKDKNIAAPAMPAAPSAPAAPANDVVPPAQS